MRLGRVCSACSLVLAFAFVSPALAADEKLTIDWIFSDEGKTAASVPSHAWLDTGIAMLYDSYPPKSERTLESFDPVTGERKVVVDAAKALASLNQVLEPEEAIEEIGWPESFDTTGCWAVYEHDGDVVLLDLRSSTFVPVAVTDADEKSARFSPNGKKLVSHVVFNELTILVRNPFLLKTTFNKMKILWYVKGLRRYGGPRVDIKRRTCGALYPTTKRILCIYPVAPASQPTHPTE